MLATALFLAPLFENLPTTVLAAIVIAASLGLMNIGEIQRYFATRRTDAILAMVALVGVVTTTVLIGLVIAALLSLVLLLYRASQPNVTVLGQLDGSAGTYVALVRHEQAASIPGLLILRVDGPLYFFNASAARQAILAAVDETDPAPDALLLDLGASPDFDITTLDLLASLIRELHERSIVVLLAQVRATARDRMRRSGLMAEVGDERVYFSVQAGVEAHRVAGANAQAADPDSTGSDATGADATTPAAAGTGAAAAESTAGA
jgi:MFS superfamily sulfate permease-like transporter